MLCTMRNHGHDNSFLLPHLCLHPHLNCSSMLNPLRIWALPSNGQRKGAIVWQTCLRSLTICPKNPCLQQCSAS